MKYRRFGRTEMMLSQFSLGCMQFTGDSPEENAIATIESLRKFDQQWLHFTCWRSI